MNKYDLVMVVDGNLTDDQKNDIYAQAAETVSKNGGKVLNAQSWVEKKKLSFLIKKKKEGTFYQTHFESAPSAIEKIDKALHLNDSVLRFLITRAV